MMLELGIIEESHSQWSSPIVLVPKPDGTTRFCNDFRWLNEISKFDAYPIPYIDELVDRLAFSTPEGVFQYTVLPFGLHGAPATFQRFMDKLLRPHTSYAAAKLRAAVKLQ
ncbi:unnamed protein product, partial [Caretta caretta]